MVRHMASFRIIVGTFCAVSTTILVAYFSKKYLISIRCSHALQKLKINQTKLPDIQCVDEMIKYGIPSDEHILIRLGFIVSYSNRLKQPNWVLELLTKDKINLAGDEVADRFKCIFTTDPEIHPLFSSKNDDYKHSGYQRGHLAAAFNHKLTQENVCTTFLLSNISPQIGKGFNQDIWRHLESYTHNLVCFYDQVYVVTGPLFLSTQQEDGNYYVKYRVIGKNEVAVPTHFFKVILGVRDDNRYEIQSFVIPNEVLSSDANFYDYAYPIQNIEKKAGLIFFDKIPRENITQLTVHEIKANIKRRRCIRRRTSFDTHRHRNSNKRNNKH